MAARPWLPRCWRRWLRPRMLDPRHRHPACSTKFARIADPGAVAPVESGIRRPAAPIMSPRRTQSPFSRPLPDFNMPVAALRGGGRIARAFGGNAAEKVVLRGICADALRPDHVRRRQILVGPRPKSLCPRHGAGGKCGDGVHAVIHA